ncbi:hypothetical protein AAY473_025482 [Plecturocebus cupreus]
MEEICNVEQPPKVRCSEGRALQGVGLGWWGDWFHEPLSERLHPHLLFLWPLELLAQRILWDFTLTCPDQLFFTLVPDEKCLRSSVLQTFTEHLLCANDSAQNGEEGICEADESPFPVFQIGEEPGPKNPSLLAPIETPFLKKKRKPLLCPNTGGPGTCWNLPVKGRKTGQSSAEV